MLGALPTVCQSHLLTATPTSLSAPPPFSFWISCCTSNSLISHREGQFRKLNCVTIALKVMSSHFRARPAVFPPGGPGRFPASGPGQGLDGAHMWRWLPGLLRRLFLCRPSPPPSQLLCLSSLMTSMSMGYAHLWVEMCHVVDLADGFLLP